MTKVFGRGAMLLVLVSMVGLTACGKKARRAELPTPPTAIPGLVAAQKLQGDWLACNNVPARGGLNGAIVRSEARRINVSGTYMLYTYMENNSADCAGSIVDSKDIYWSYTAKNETSAKVTLQYLDEKNEEIDGEVEEVTYVSPTQVSWPFFGNESNPYTFIKQ